MSIINYIYNYTMLNEDYKKDFNLQYSYDKDPDFEKDYFQVVSYNSDNEPHGLKINIHKNDKPFLKESKTEPRSEIRCLKNINDNAEYVVEWKQYLESYSSDYNFSFFQLFAKNGPNIMLRLRNGTFELLALQGKNNIITIDLDIHDDLHRWIEWKIEFLLSHIAGYIKVFKDDKLIGELHGNTSGDNESYLKLGFYSHDIEPECTNTLYLKDLNFFQNNKI